MQSVCLYCHPPCMYPTSHYQLTSRPVLHTSAFAVTCIVALLRNVMTDKVVNMQCSDEFTRGSESMHAGVNA